MNELQTNFKEITSSFLDFPSNSGMCVSVYFTGCMRLCDECQNFELQDPESGTEISLSKIINIISLQTSRFLTNQICLLGGDPLFPKNLPFTRELLLQLGKTYDFCIYTGYDLDYVRSNQISNFKFLKCGRYINSLFQTSEKTDEYFQLASSNQKIYDSNFRLISNNGRMYFKEKFNEHN